VYKFKHPCQGSNISTGCFLLPGILIQECRVELEKVPKELKGSLILLNPFLRSIFLNILEEYEHTIYYYFGHFQVFL
jgi:hypothetical protein